MNQRIDYIDAVKGFAILLMVMAHTIAWNFADWKFLTYDVTQLSTGELQAGFIWKLIYSFHMPLFFLVSGYFTFKQGGVTLVNLLTGKVQRLLIPYISTGFLILFLKGYYGYWFLFSLFELSVIGILLFKILSTINKKKRWWIDIIAICITYVIVRNMLKLSFLENPFCNIGKAVGYMLPFLFGMFLRKYESIKEKVLGLYEYYIPLFVIMFAWRYFPIMGFDGILFKLGNQFNKFLFPIMASLMVISIFKAGINHKVQNVLANIGKRSLEVYILHLFFVVQLPVVGDFWLKTNLPTCLATQILYSLSASGIAIALSCAVAAFFKKNKFISKVLFGI